ncbi:MULTISPECIES: glycosyltransferase family 2 protein [Aminobacter]|jgi:GT2 family glycosyltransferase|uniref:GT2 family glycosyltransferase n=1 Tax=Aminobacter aminovorans TaxID=83263 RepID=A0AAC8YLJ6_AMIAI|nr:MULTISPECIES: glycosyltransferase [Aminobacter]AMS40226.1 Glycosyl transferase family 2 [Aminobacter aminovorans]MBB3709719.1 GT2 family glycosyltransferase [Aminobacter aminovorans]MRX35272.1 glycosyltransferase [Aminobacter sp. MDW-2]QNH35698.1 glycosyltransferase [Aminobacter sp. MDW-2]QOF69586.1 glycosyltransferase [Aminobacter sp. SR38]
MKPEVDLIVVTHNSGSVLPVFLATVPSCANVVVVDNASVDDSVTLAEAAGAKVIEIEENVGYGSACNVGAAAGNAPFLLLANPDLRFEAGAIEALVAAAAAHPDAAFNPRFYSGSRRRFRRWSRLLPASDFWHGAPPNHDCAIPVLHGACIFIRRKHFEQVGGFDQNIFLFHEDDDLSVRLLRVGVELRLAAGAAVDHAEGRSSARSVESGRVKGEAMGRSLVYVMNKHQMPLDVPAERFRTWLKLLWPHVLFSSARRSKLLGFANGLNGGPMGSFGKRQ